MRKYLIGGLVGFLVPPIALMLFLLLTFGSEPFYHAFTDPGYPEETEGYRNEADYYSTDYKLEAAFLDEDSIISHNRPMGLYREEPVIAFDKRDYQSVCVSHYDAEYMDFAITLTANARDKVLESFQYQEAKFENSFREGGFEKRYYLEASGNRIFWFWVTGGGAAAYETAIKAAPAQPDMILKVPMDQLYNFQFYLINGMTDKPPLGCTPDVDPRKMPAWMDLIIPFWATSEYYREQANKQD